MTIAYAVMFALAALLLVCHLLLVKKREPWLTLLFACVTVVNFGYFLLSLAKTLPFAIFANDVAYLGSVFLVLCMFFTVVKLCGFVPHRALVITLLSLGALMFLIVCTAGFLPLYYREVTLVFVDGAAKLEKVYGVLHPVYLVYTLEYFAAMITAILHSARRRKVGKRRFAALIAAVVCGNILVWVVEKFIPWEFEFLSVTYILSELVLLLVYWMIEEYVCVQDMQHDAGEEARMARALTRLPKGEALSTRESEILALVLRGKKRRDIAATLHLSENTVKTYTRTLYAKLDVASRDELYAWLEQ